MNASSLYTTTNQIILKSDQNDPSTWEDLYRLLPYLRNSLSCVVCESLLTDPISPSPMNCQHHVCKNCKTGKKRIKPACTSCKDCIDYSENRIIKIILQCYKQMCINLQSSNIFQELMRQASTKPSPKGIQSGAGNLLVLIKEGAEYYDDYLSEEPPSIYKLLPCIFTNRSLVPVEIFFPDDSETEPTATPSTSQDSRKRTFPMDDIADKKTIVLNTVIKKPSRIPPKPKMGCRCGNATIQPGKLTCCGQRCICYVDSKACIDCKCRGCRNPHTADGYKVRSINDPLNVQEINYVPANEVLVPQKKFEYNQVSVQMNAMEPQLIPPVQPHILDIGIQPTLLEIPHLANMEPTVFKNNDVTLFKCNI